LASGRLSGEDEVDVSVKAWRTEGSRMFIREGTKVRIDDLMKGIIIQSGNDASVAIAEHIAGSEDAFADVMNQQAVLLGMNDTQYQNATGLPNEDHYTTAADLAKLTTALIKNFPEHYSLYGEKYFSYNDIRQPNRNLLLWRDKSVDGVKTGHTDSAGYCLVSSALRDDMRLISVVMGASSEEARATESQKLLSYGFRYFETLRLYKADETLRTVKVWGGQTDRLDLGVAEAVVLTVTRGTKAELSATLDIDGVMYAPVKRGDKLGQLKISDADGVIAELPLIALMDIPEAGFFSSLWDSISLFFTQLFSGDALAV
jgi:D-alanyl-D-alanine carboxypeptidase (penicillin-binding protein 5/6)